MLFIIRNPSGDLAITYVCVYVCFLSQCPPCRSLTRVLVESYRKVKESGHKFEIVFVSADRYETHTHTRYI